MFLLILRKIILILLRGIGSIGAPGLGNASRLHDRHPLPAFRKGSRIERIAQFVRGLIGAKERDILLTKGKIHRSKPVKGSQFARIDLKQANVGPAVARFFLLRRLPVLSIGEMLLLEARETDRYAPVSLASYFSIYASCTITLCCPASITDSCLGKNAVHR